MTSSYNLGGAEAQPKHPNTTLSLSSSSHTTSPSSASAGSLVSNQTSITTTQKQRTEQRRCFGWAARNYNHHTFGGHTRIGNCARRPIGSNIALKRTENGTVHASGLMQCGSVHACPPCAAKIRYQRATEIDHKAKAHLEPGGGLVFLTVTLPHTLSENLADLWDVVAKAWSQIITGKAYYGNKTTTGAKEEFGIVGFIRAFDLTHSPTTGWHPHLHVLIFLNKPITELDDEFWELKAWFRHRWTTRIGNLTGKTVHDTFGVHAESVKNASGVGTYVSKINMELARSDLKKARAYGSRTPFQILEAAIDLRHPNDRRLWVEYVSASKGRQIITITKNLKQMYPPEEVEQSDEEIANAKQEGDTELLINRSVWRHIADRHPKLIAQIISAQQNEGATQVFRIIHHKLWWTVFDTTGDIPQIKPKQRKPEQWL